MPGISPAREAPPAQELRCCVDIRQRWPFVVVPVDRVQRPGGVVRPILVGLAAVARRPLPAPGPVTMIGEVASRGVHRQVAGAETRRVRVRRVSQSVAHPGAGVALFRRLVVARGGRPGVE